MKFEKNIYQLQGKVRNYDWGGTTFLPNLLGLPNKDNQPFAEYWMGAHTSAPSLLVSGGEAVPLNKLIETNKKRFLGEKVAQQFGELPYLFKILDVRQMLSIQVHPSKEEAEKGFDEEEKKGIPLDASERNYKDRNHKPEIMIALGEFWLLHGFLTMDRIEQVLERIEAFNFLKPDLHTHGIKGLYQRVMEMPQKQVNEVLSPLVQSILAEEQTNKSEPDYWVQKLFPHRDFSKIHNIDKGIFSIYFFNIVKAEKGTAIFQGAGLPHAYLEGHNVELMANSDNVLRGGLTTKHVDVPELLKHTSFVGIDPQPLQARENKSEKLYDCPVPDFGISEIILQKDEVISLKTSSLEILFVLQGAATVCSNGEKIEASKGASIAVLPESEFEIIARQQQTTIYKAFVPE